ncbi:MAG: SpoIID/LytB domain-containing protein [Clostridia bacterium]|nr:SpoIID/LytB domain-containing protein [Clostridia bacterium]MBR4260876.1 SpoIID/LytB domain-containing protein [Clostridia bacterium]
MKKIVLYVLVLVIITFIIPFVLTKQTVESNSLIAIKKNEYTDSNNNKSIDTTPYNYSNYNTIKLLHNKTNEVEEIPLDEYLYGVVSAEMPADFDIEALKAQAIVARTYTIYKISENQSKHEIADICDNSSCCQAWISKEDRMARWEENKREENWNKIVCAVTETKGKIITFEGKPINAFFHSNSGGTTEIPANVWGGSRISIFANCRNIW